jgi:hypothetical protein
MVNETKQSGFSPLHRHITERNAAISSPVHTLPCYVANNCVTVVTSAHEKTQLAIWHMTWR